MSVTSAANNASCNEDPPNLVVSIDYEARPTPLSNETIGIGNDYQQDTYLTISKYAIKNIGGCNQTILAGLNITKPDKAADIFGCSGYPREVTIPPKSEAFVFKNYIDFCTEKLNATGRWRLTSVILYPPNKGSIGWGYSSYFNGAVAGGPFSEFNVKSKLELDVAELTRKSVDLANKNYFLALLVAALAIIQIYYSKKQIDNANKLSAKENEHLDRLLESYKEFQTKQQAAQTSQLEKLFEKTVDENKKHTQKIKDEIIELLNKIITMVESLKKRKRK